MNEQHTFNLYCDESCHLEHDRSPVMALGAVWCERAEVAELSESIRAIKQKHSLARDFEIKWTKVSPAKLAFYVDLVKLFVSDERLRFRGLIVPDKGRLDHAAFDQTHDDFYYKMYFVLLKFVVGGSHRYRIYLDIKDTRGGAKAKKLHDVLANKFHDFEHKSIERVQQVRSHESELLQLADLLIGALSYANRGLSGSPAKNEIVAMLRAAFGANALTRTSKFDGTKFNVLLWDAREAAG